MTNNATKTYRVTVIERALAYYKVEAEDARAAAENWPDGEFDSRDDEALDTDGPSSVRERQPDGSWRKVPQSEWGNAPDIARPLDAERERQAAAKLLAGLTWLLDDLTDAGEDRNPATGEKYDSVAFARSAVDEARAAGIEPALGTGAAEEA